MQHNVIVNPNSGNGRGLKIWNKTKKILEDKHIEYEVYFTIGIGDAIKKASELTADRTKDRHIVVLGGDGTVNEVLNGICMEAPVTLSYIPTGSGNDLARGMALEKNLKKYVSGIFGEGRIEMVDYGVLTADNGNICRRFMVSGGVGYDAAVCFRLNDSPIKEACNKVGMGKAGYLIEGARELISSKQVKGYLVLDNEKRVDFNNIFFLSAHINPFEGGGFKFAPLADNKDGLLEICVVNKKSKTKTIPVLLNAKVKGLKNDNGVRFFQCREATLHLDSKVAVHTDGELMGYQDRIDFRCVRQQLALLR